MTPNETQKDLLLHQGQALTEIEEGSIPDDQVVVSFDAQVRIRRHKNTYVAWKVQEKDSEAGEEFGDWLQISNFVVRCITLERFIDQREQDVQRKVRLTDDTGKSFECFIRAEDMNTKGNFVKWAQAKGNYTFTGSEAQLQAINLLTFPSGMEEVQVKNIAGHDTKTGTWVFGNCAVFEGKVYKTDDAGLLSLPASGDNTLPGRRLRLVEPDLDITVARLPMLKFDTPEHWRWLLLETLKDMTRLWGPQVELVVGWFIAILFRSRCMSDVSLTNFPLLFISSPPRQGKSAMLKMLMRMYGLNAYNPTPLSSLTETSVYTLPNVVCDLPVWIDEYREDAIKKKLFLREALKNNYDGSRRTVGTLSEFVTKSRTARTGFVVTGEMRASNEALDSRCVNVELQHFGDPVLLNTVEKRAENLCAVLLHVLGDYEAYWTLFHDRLEAVCQVFSQDPMAQIRAVENYAKPCAALDILIPDGKRAERFMGWLTGKVERNKETTVLSDMVSELPFLIQRNKCPIQYKIFWDQKRLHVQAGFLVQEFFREHRDVDKYKIDELLRMGTNSGLFCPGLHVDGKLVRAYVTGHDRDTGVTTDTQQRCFIFDLNNPVVRDAAQKLEPDKE